MEKEKRERSPKGIVIVLVAIFLIAAALFAVSIWDRSRGQYPSSDQDDKTLTVDGKEYVKREGIETFLVIGIDRIDDGNDSETPKTIDQADFLLLFVFDNSNKTCSTLQINRDTIANVNRLDVGGNKIQTEKKQIALAYNFAYETGGKISCRNTADSVSDLLYGVKIDHYLSVTMDSVPTINDLVGGVEVTVLNDFSAIDSSLVKGETVTLVGKQALTYVRTRNGLDDSSNEARMKRQEQYLNALVKKARACSDSDPDFVVNSVSQVGSCVVYDSTEYRMKEFAEKFDEYDFLGLHEIEGESKLGETYMEFYPDEDALLQLVADLFYQPKE